jgi:16S rRNA (uracil1498-N3)-methyltransferase
MRRYYSRQPLHVDQPVWLDDKEAHHLLHVLRARAGDQVILFDGCGAQFDARVTACKRNQVELHVETRHEIDRETAFPLWCGIALPKGERQRWLVEKLTELGVARLTPLVTDHAERVSAAHVEKLAQHVIQASKQCGRNRLMQIDPPYCWQDWLHSANAADSFRDYRYLAHPGRDETCDAAVASIGDTSRHAVQISIGPEGGFSADEVRQAVAAGLKRIDLGSRILRIETAAIAIAARLNLFNGADVPPPPT